jgi:hypothetical protein
MSKAQLTFVHLAPLVGRNFFPIWLS